MTDPELKEKRIDHMVWAIQHHAQLHKGLTKTEWPWALDKPDNRHGIKSCITLLMTGNGNDIAAHEMNEEQKHEVVVARSRTISAIPHVPAGETQIMLQTVMTLFAETMPLTAERKFSIKQVASAYQHCLQDLIAADVPDENPLAPALPVFDAV